MKNETNNAGAICIRCLHLVAFCDCVQGARVTRHPATCACAGCEIGRGDYNDNDGADDDEQHAA